jgi:hypothetical protein
MHPMGRGFGHAPFLRGCSPTGPTSSAHPSRRSMTTPHRTGEMRRCTGTTEFCTGTTRHRTGATELCTGAMELCTGTTGDCTGATRHCTGAMGFCTGTTGRCTGTTRLCTGAIKLCTGTTRHRTGTTGHCTGAMELCTGTTDDCTGTTERCTGTTELCTGTSERCTGAMGLESRRVSRRRSPSRCLCSPLSVLPDENRRVQGKGASSLLFRHISNLERTHAPSTSSGMLRTGWARCHGECSRSRPH